MDVPFQCPFCEHANQQGANYCSNCGQRLQLKVCPECGVVSDQIADRCYQCGTTFPATPEADAAQAACERVRQILRGDAIPSDPAGGSSAGDGDRAGADTPGAIQAAAEDVAAHHAHGEPAIARERFSGERMFRFPGADDNGLSQDFNLLRPIEVTLAPDPGSERAFALPQLRPVQVLEPSGATDDQPLSPATGPLLQVRSMLRVTRATWIGATVAISIALVAYSVYRVAASDAPGADRPYTAGTARTPTEPTSGRLVIRNAEEIAAGARTTPTAVTPEGDPIKSLGIALPAASELPSAPPARARPGAKDAGTQGPNAPAGAGPSSCTEGVVALGLCSRAGENE
jgi:hypothetical protein